MNAARQNEQSIFHTFFKYVSSNVLGMIGFSCYILADVFFIARGIGADALAALNLTLPAYNLMNGIGLMIGMGGAARYSLSSTRPDSDTHRTAFTHALLLAALCALFFSFAGAFCSEEISAILGADHDTIGYASDYIRILLLFSPLFLGNNLLLCFVRNELPDFLWRECLSEVLPTLYWTIFLSIRLAWKWQEPPLRLQLLL